MKKMLVSDYDGTYFLNKEDMKQNNKEVKLFRKKGNVFVIATGRGYRGIIKRCHNYQIEYDYLIINQGTTILDRQNNILYNIYLEEELLTQILEDLEIERCSEYHCYSKLEDVDFYHKKINKINLCYRHREDAFTMCQFLNEKYAKKIHAYVVGKRLREVEIIGALASKKDAIHILEERLNIEKENIYTIGDSYSDIPMIVEYQGGVMEHSVVELKELHRREYQSVSQFIKEIEGKNS